MGRPIGCHGKERRSLSEAVKVANRELRRGMLTASAYFCDHCGSYHNTLGGLGFWREDDWGKATEYVKGIRQARLDESAWRWVRPESLVEEDVDDAAAHALLFRAMVEGLKSPNLLRPCPFGNEGRWYVSDDAGNRVYGDTALDALINFYEGADHAG